MPASFARAAHGQLVSKIADGGEAHAWDAEVFAQCRGIFDIEFVERHDAVDGLPASEVAYGIDDGRTGNSSGMKNNSSMASRGQSPSRSFSTVSSSTRQPMFLQVRRNSWPFS